MVNELSGLSLRVSSAYAVLTQLVETWQGMKRQKSFKNSIYRCLPPIKCFSLCLLSQPEKSAWNLGQICTALSFKLKSSEPTCTIYYQLLLDMGCTVI
jgi:hypothetical protein